MPLGAGCVDVEVKVLPFGAVTAVVPPLPDDVLEPEVEVPLPLPLPFSFVVVPPLPVGVCVVVGVLDVVGDALGVSDVVGCVVGVFDVVGGAGSLTAVAVGVAAASVVDATWLTVAACTGVTVVTWCDACGWLAAARCARDRGAWLPDVA